MEEFHGFLNSKPASLFMSQEFSRCKRFHVAKSYHRAIFSDCESFLVKKVLGVGKFSCWQKFHVHHHD